MRTDKLTIAYDEFPEENVKVLTVARGDRAIWMFYDDDAEKVYNLLLGEEVE